MSGICGIAGFGGQPVPVGHVERMVRATPHRGAGRLWSGPGAVLAQQQRHGASTPSSSGADVVVVADARIDNASDLRRGLRRGGYLSAAQDSQTDILRAAYEAWGDRCAERIIGDFCFVVWDVRRQTLLAARDPLAMRSLFYRRESSGQLLFATEVKQLLAVPGVPDTVAETAAAVSLSGGFPRADTSFYEGIDQLAPGCTMIADEGQLRVRRHWNVDPDHRVGCRSAEEAAEELRRVFLQAVAARLDPAAPTGILLSGGVDSGSVASAAGALVEQQPSRTPRLHAVSWAFEELPQCDERHISRHVVERYGLLTTDVRADDAGALACYPEHAPDLDDPVMGTFQPLIEHSLEAAREQGIGVLLGGDRGDLVIGSVGFSYLRMIEAGQWSDLIPSLREHHRVLGDSWPLIARRHFVGAVGGRLRKRSASGWAGWALERARRSPRASHAAGPPEWLRPSFLRSVDLDGSHADESAPEGLGYVRGLRYQHIFTPLHLRGVAWSERTYARYGLGFADPFSDRRLVELAIALPPAVINRPGDLSKPLMREAIRGVMPEAARRTADKIYPTPLYEQSLRRRAALVRSLFTTSQLEERGWVDEKLLRRHFDQWLAGGPLRPELWMAIQLETWLRAHHA